MRLTLFVKEGCWGCHEWVNLLEAKRIPFFLADIDENLRAREYIQKMHRGQVPVLRDEDSGQEYEGFQSEASEGFLSSVSGLIAVLPGKSVP